VLAVVGVGLVVALLVTVYGTFRWGWAWTGFRDKDNATLWSWLELVLLPVTIALLPLWLHSRQRRKAYWRVGLGVLALVFAVLAVGGYRWNWGWTGFQGNTLWDWLKLLLVPFAVPAAVAWATTPALPPARPVGGSAAAARPPAAPRPTGAEPRTGGIAPARNAPTRLVQAHPALAVATLLTLAGLAATAALLPGPTARPATAATPAVKVSSRMGWTDTAIHLSKRERVTITATGEVDPDGPRGPSPAVGPDGSPQPRLRAFSVLRSAPHAALIGEIVGSGQGHPFLVGSRYHTDSSDQSGLLLLGVNDRGLSNNTGEFTARIDVATPQHGARARR
jgi:hypothetical protein